MSNSEERIAKDLSQEIESILSRAGLFYRIFFRTKNQESIEKKIEIKNYSANGKKLQDLIGIRVALYFADDLALVKSILKKKLSFSSETIDKPEEDEFKPTRINLIFNLSESHKKQLLIVKKFSEIDFTYELQLRTILSEGWHEVEHDLRYKCKDEWENQLDLSRTLNGVFATLETCDWSILKIFEELSYRHYKSKNWQAMLRNKFRIRFEQVPLSNELTQILNNDNSIAKSILRVNRNKMLKKFLDYNISFPFLFSNIIFITNFLYVKNEEIMKITPRLILDKLEAI